MKRILIVSFFFPPTNAIGAIRVGKFAKYLPGFGWEPWVLTINPDLLNVPQDLPVEIPADRVIRADFGRLTKMVKRGRAPSAADVGAVSARTTRPGLAGQLRRRALAVVSDSRLPDRGLPWNLPALRAGSALLATHRFDAILSSHGPPASSMVASVLARRHHLPWVADFRDLWTQNHAHKDRPRIIHWMEQRVERHFMRRCLAMTTVSLPLKQQLEALHRKPVTVITNGFDEAEHATVPVEARSDDILRIVYTGMIYEGEQDPSPLFRAVRALLDAGKLDIGTIRIEFYGVSPVQLEAQAASLGVRDVVFAFPRIPHAEARKRQCQADILLLLDWTSPAVKGYASGKLFEYFGAQKPILAIGPRESVIQGLLAETRAGVLATSTEGVRKVLERWLEARSLSGVVPYEGDITAMRRYSRRAQVRLLASVLDGAVTVAGRVP